jgi:hypothetical protein
MLGNNIVFLISLKIAIYLEAIPAAALDRLSIPAAGAAKLAIPAADIWKLAIPAAAVD